MDNKECVFVLHTFQSNRSACYFFCHHRRSCNDVALSLGENEKTWEGKKQKKRKKPLREKDVYIERSGIVRRSENDDGQTVLVVVVVVVEVVMSSVVLSSYWRHCSEQHKHTLATNIISYNISNTSPSCSLFFFFFSLPRLLLSSGSAFPFSLMFVVLTLVCSMYLCGPISERHLYILSWVVCFLTLRRCSPGDYRYHLSSTSSSSSLSPLSLTQVLLKIHRIISSRSK